VLTLACAAPVFTALGDAPVALTIGLIVPALITLQWLVQRRGGWRLIGPHSYYDLIRMARKRRTIVLRVLFLLALFAGIWYTYEQAQARRNRPELEIGGTGQSRQQLARLNMECVYAWLLLQNITILILTPAYVGGAIAEERERGTLDLLVTTELRNDEIVLGKLLARVVHLGAFLIAGLPVFSIMLVWGGIDLWLLLAGWVNSLLLLLAVCSVCIMFSTMPVRASTAVIVSYAVVLPAGSCWLGCAYEVLQEYTLGAAGSASAAGLVVLAVAYAFVIVFCVLLAINAIRPPELPPDEVAPAIGVHPMRVMPTSPVPKDLSPARTWPLPPVGDNALLWKERYTGGRSLLQIPEVLVAGVFPLAVMAPLFGVSLVEAMEKCDGTVSGFLHEIAEAWRAVLYGGYVVFLLSYVCGVAFRSAACVVRERQMHTLDMLLQLPIERGEILRAKWSGALLKGWPWLIALIADLALGLVIGVYHPSTFLLMLFAPLPVIVALSTAGLLISTIVRTTTQANLTMACTLLVFAVYVGYRWPERLFGYLPGSRGGWPNPPFQPDDLTALVVSAATLLLVAAAMRAFAGWAFERR
jgi:ABC-type transport system involved in multi-copper enzyme maturation permease subunit